MKRASFRHEVIGSAPEARLSSVGWAFLLGLLGWAPTLACSLIWPDPAELFLHSPILRRNLALATIVIVAVAFAVAALSTLFASGASGGSRPGGPLLSRPFEPLAIVCLANLFLLLTPSFARARLDRLGLPHEVDLLLLVLACLVAAGVLAKLVAAATRRGSARWQARFDVASVVAFTLVWVALMRFRLEAPFSDPRFGFVVISSLAQASLLLTAALRPERLARGATALAPILVVLAGVAVLVTSNARIVERRPVAAPAVGPASPPTVLVLMIDTLRADRTSVGGDSLETTPTLRAIAGDGSTYFSATSSAASATRPSVKSLFTSIPWSLWDRDAGKPLPAKAWTMASAFRDSGYRTAAFSASGVASADRYGNGFDRFESISGREFAQRSFALNDLLSGGNDLSRFRLVDRYRLHKERGEIIWSRAAKWLAAAPGTASFLYVHLVEPHWPFYDEGHGFVAPELARIRRKLSHVDLLERGRAPVLDPAFRASPEMRELKARYDEGVRAADEVLARILRDLQEAHRLDSTLLVVIGDHGEEFLEHGRFGHGHDVHEVQIHVPMLIRWPRHPAYRAMPARIDHPVSLMDLLPTLADLLSLKGASYPIHGLSLRPLLEGRAAFPRSSTTSESFESGGLWRGAYREGHLKVRVEIRLAGSGSPEIGATLFDLSVDPSESHPRQPENAAQADLVRRAVDQFRRRWERWGDDRATAATARGDAPPVDEDVRQLRALGYVR